TELDLPGNGIALVHREVDDPAEAKFIRIDETQILAQLRAYGAGELLRHCPLVRDEEERIPVCEPGRGAQSRNLARIEMARDRSLGTAFGKDEVTEARGALLPRPVVELVEETPRAVGGTRRGNRPHNSTGGDSAGEERKATVAEYLRHIGDEQRI